VLHVGAVTLPALIAVAELRPGMTGPDFLRAALAGYETGPRVWLMHGTEHIGQGWHSGATVGYSPPRRAPPQACGFRSIKRSMRSECRHPGRRPDGGAIRAHGQAHACGPRRKSGLYGALLAEAGFTGIVDVFESPYGASAAPSRARTIVSIWPS